jgi:hypothetical protein
MCDGELVWLAAARNSTLGRRRRSPRRPATERSAPSKLVPAGSRGSGSRRSLGSPATVRESGQRRDSVCWAEVGGAPALVEQGTCTSPRRQLVRGDPRRS